MLVTKHDIILFTLPLKEKVLKVDCGFLYTIKDSNGDYKTFLNVFSNLYEITFPKLILKSNLVHGLQVVFQNLLKVSKNYMKNF